IRRALDYNPDAIRMYMKLMYLQGTSNAFLVESAREYGHNLIMPYVDARLVYLKMKYQDELKNLIHPRYVLEQTLRDHFGFDPGIIDSFRKCRIEPQAVQAFTPVEREVYDEWDRLSNQLL
ncbi:MAG: hypothetical protein AB1744_14430, partial [Candidatus Zixiibacteriota bacterium]